jgi:hypothetical protein
MYKYVTVDMMRRFADGSVFWWPAGAAVWDCAAGNWFASVRWPGMWEDVAVAAWVTSGVASGEDRCTAAYVVIDDCVMDEYRWSAEERSLDELEKSYL